ncbi:MAG: enoyl-CoA hydratase-related protein [Sedimentibacter sp.]
MFNNLLINYEESIAILTFNRPDCLNALNTAVLEELNQAMEMLEKDESINVIIITGNGKAFVAGADISEMKDKTVSEAKAFSNLGSKLFRKIELMNKPVIAAVNGYALGGGCELAMACDIIIASENAKFGQPEVGLGIIPGYSGTQRLPRLVGVKKAKELIFTAETINAVEAEKIGLLNKVVLSDQLIEVSLELARRIVSKGQTAVKYAKNAINCGIEVDIDTGISIEENFFALCFDTNDQKEGMSAFLEKRKPNFNN